jgi:ferredoxin
MFLLMGLPLAMLLFGWLGGRVGVASVAWHPAGEVAMMLEADAADGSKRPNELVAFFRNDGDRVAAFARAASVEQQAMRLGWVMGALFGVVALTKVARAIFPESSADYVTDRGRCVSCARCYSSCPYELQRRGMAVTLPKGGSDE